jgi:hypothetical protein
MYVTYVNGVELLPNNEKQKVALPLQTSILNDETFRNAANESQGLML